MSQYQYTAIVGPLTTFSDTSDGWLEAPQAPQPRRCLGIIAALTVAACVLPPMLPMKFGLDANTQAASLAEYTEAAQRHGFRRASHAGIDYIHYAKPWSTVETSAGVYDLTSLSWMLAEHPGTVSVTITVVNYDGTKNLPTYLGAAAFDDASVTTAYNNLLDAVFAVTGNRVEYVSLGQEIEVYFGAHTGEISAFGTLCGSAKTKVNTLWDGVPTIVSWKSASVAAGQVQSTYASVYANTTRPGVTYYFINGDYTIRDSNPATLNATLYSDILAVFSGLGGTQPIIFTEIGCPTSSLLGASEALQSQFVTQMCAVAEVYNGFALLTHMNYNWQVDWAPWLLDFFGLSGTQRTFVGSLGLNHADGSPKDGMRSFVTAMDGEDIGLYGSGPTDWRPIQPDRNTYQKPRPVEFPRGVHPLYLSDVTTTAPALSWRPTYPDRIPPRRLLAVGSQRSFTQNELSIPPLFSSGGGTISALGTYILWQYQALSGPLLISQDSLDFQWLTSQYPSQIPVRRLPVAAYPTWTFDKWDAPSAPSVPTFFGYTQPPSMARGRVPQHYQAQAFAFDTRFLAPPQNIATTLWRPVTPDRPFKEPYRLAAYTWAQPHFVVQIPVPVMSWTGLYLDPPVLRKRIVWTDPTVTPIFVSDTSVTVPALSWDGEYPAEVRGLRRSVAALVASGVSPIYLADITVVAPTLGARAIYPDQIWAKVALRDQKAFFFDRFAAPTPVIAPDLAVPVYVNFVPGKPPMRRHPTSVGPEYVLDVTVPAPLMSWRPEYPDQHLVVARLIEAIQKAYVADTNLRPTTAFNVAWVKVNFYLGAGPAGEPEGD